MLKDKQTRSKQEQKIQAKRADLHQNSAESAPLNPQHVLLADASIPLAQRQAAALQLNRIIGNRSAAQLLPQAAQRDNETGNIAKLKEMLNRFNVPENEVIGLMGKLTPAEVETISAGTWYRDKTAGALDWGEMVRAMTNLNAKIWVKLNWLDKVAKTTSAIDYHEIKGFIAAAPADDTKRLTTPYWKSFFISVCTNADIIEAVGDLKLALGTQLEWISAEVASVRASFAYSDIQQLVKDASQTDRDALKTSASAHQFFMEVCDNETIIQAVKDLNFDIQTRVKWILDEGNASDLLGGGIDPAQMYDAIKDKLTGEALQIVELASLNRWKEADYKRLREIMDSQDDDRPAYEDTLGEAAQKLAGPAGELIEKHTTSHPSKAGTVKSLSTTALAKELSGMLQSNPALVRQVLDILTAGAQSYLSNLDDDVAVKTLEAVKDDETLKAIARTDDGRALLLTMVRKLFKGVNMGDEEKQQTRVLQAVSAVDAEKREREGATSEVEVVTFLYGGKGLDSAGDALGSYRGHTALFVNGLAYSFEAGWSCGHTKASYLSVNEFRDAVGQVLKVTEEDAKSLQENLNKSCGTGVYAAPNICTGEASKALDKALRGGIYQTENPQLFAQYLESTGLVKGRRFYPKKDKK